MTPYFIFIAEYQAEIKIILGELSRYPAYSYLVLSKLNIVKT